MESIELQSRELEIRLGFSSFLDRLGVDIGLALSNIDDLCTDPEFLALVSQYLTYRSNEERWHDLLAEFMIKINSKLELLIKTLLKGALNENDLTDLIHDTEISAGLFGLFISLIAGTSVNEFRMNKLVVAVARSRSAEV